jgi:hypothetical protein
MKNSIRKIFSKNGFSLVEIMIAAGLLGLVSLGVVSLMKDTDKVQKSTASSSEVDQLVVRMNILLSDPKICKSTFFNLNPTGNGVAINNIILKEDIDLVKAWKGATKDIDSSEIGEYQSKTIRSKFLSADCTLPNVANCTLASGSSGRIWLKQMKILAFEMTHSTSSDTKSPYRNGPNQATFEFTMVKGPAIGKEGDIVEMEKAKGQLFGQVVITKQIPVVVSLDSNKRITDCVTNMSDYAESTCHQINGTLENDKCKTPTIMSKSVSSFPAITAIGNMNIEGNEFIAGNVIVGTSPGGAVTTGSMNAGGNFTIGKSLAIINGPLAFGSVATNDTVLSATGNNELTLGTPTGGSGRLNLGNQAYLKGSGANLGISKSSPTKSLDISGDGLITSNLTVDGDTSVKSKTNVGNATLGTMEILSSGGENRLRISGADLSIIAHNDTFNNAWATSQTDANLVATRDWVYQLFANRLGNAASNAIIDNIIEYSASAPLDSVVKSFCASVRGSNGANSPCQVTLPACGANDVLRGYNADGSANCFNPLAFNCPTGQTITQINGSIITCSSIEDRVYNSTYLNNIKAKVNQCKNSTYPSGSGYNSQNYNWTTGTCSAIVWTSYTQNKGCGNAWDNDSSGDCNCGSFGANCQYQGSDGCTFNWVVAGYSCRCICSQYSDRSTNIGMP